MPGKSEKAVLKLFKFPVENEFDLEKCKGCNYDTSTKYVIATSEDEARRLLNDGSAGVCADCICDAIGNHFIITQERLKTLKTEIDGAITAIEEWNEGKRDLTMGELFDRLVRLQRMLEN